MITKLAFSNHSTRLASGSRGSVIIWSVKNEEESGIVGAGLLGEVVADLIWRPDDRRSTYASGELFGAFTTDNISLRSYST